MVNSAREAAGSVVVAALPGTSRWAVYWARKESWSLFGKADVEG
jgi:hypothetical protein